MKSLETVIKQKCKFLGNTKKSYILGNRTWDDNTGNILFRQKISIETENMITSLKEITPLFVYISSYLRYNRGESEANVINIELVFIFKTFNRPDPIKFWGYLLDNPIAHIRSKINRIYSDGHYVSFLEPFGIIMRLENNSYFNLGFEIYESYNESIDEDVETINDIKTFKHDLCTICLERIPNVLFCLCGHICICEKCNEIKKLDECPICKTNNKIKE